MKVLQYFVIVNYLINLEIPVYLMLKILEVTKYLNNSVKNEFNLTANQTLSFLSDLLSTQIIFNKS